MDVAAKNSGPVTPVKTPKSNRSKVSEIPKDPENQNPNLESPNSRLSIKSARKTQISARKSPKPVVASPSPRNKIRERKFVVARKNTKREKPNSSNVACNCKISGKSEKCVCVAYETLRASQEEFFKNRANVGDLSDRAENGIQEEEEMKPITQNPTISDRYEENGLDESEVTSEVGQGSTCVKRRRDKCSEEARQSVPEAGKVMRLIKAFEKLRTRPKAKEADEKDEKEPEDRKIGTKWALPGLQPNDPEAQVSSSSFCPSDFFVTSESLGLDPRVCSSLDSSRGSFTISSRNSHGGQSSRRNSCESSGTFVGRHRNRRQHKVTSLKPFKLRTEQRGRSKEEQFIKKVEERMMEEEKLRIPVAQGLPWTTDEPECLAKPPVKESTRPVDLVLHSDVRAVERSEFDHQVAEKMSFIEQYRMELERQRKLAEEEEKQRLRKELVPKAQPMPYFDRPFIPRRSEKHPTIPREPRFHLPQHKKIKSCMSWNDMYIHQHY